MNQSVAYKGRLPAYALGADRRRLVRLLCKGQCCKTRWAEMTVDYPGETVLRDSQLLQFQARCLVCGRIACDPYNWYR